MLMEKCKTSVWQRLTITWRGSKLSECGVVNYTYATWWWWGTLGRLETTLDYSWFILYPLSWLRGEQINLGVWHTRLCSNKMREYTVCWTDLWCRVTNSSHLPLAASPGASLGSGSTFSLNWASNARSLALTAVLCAAFRQSWQFISH